MEPEAKITGRFGQQPLSKAALCVLMENGMKGKTGLRRLVNACGYSLSGLATAFRFEAAFRQELLLAAVLIPVALLIGRSGVEKRSLWGQEAYGVRLA